MEALARAVIEVGVSNESSRLLGTSMCENRTETIEQRSAVRNVLMQVNEQNEQYITNHLSKILNVLMQNNRSAQAHTHA